MRHVDSSGCCRSRNVLSHAHVRILFHRCERGENQRFRSAIKMLSVLL